MATITIDIPDELSDELDHIRDRLPELLRLSLQQPALPASVYRAILEFLASRPTPAQIAAFGPTPDMQARLAVLLERSANGALSLAEDAELAEFERIEHLMVLLKAGNLSSLTAAP